MFSQLCEEKQTEVLDAIGHIRKELGYSYPYKAGSVTMNCAGYDKTVVLCIVKHFLDANLSIVVNYEKKTIKFTGYM
jgi:hypothetical protein